MPRTHGIDEYLEAIYVLDAEGDVVLPSRLADYLDVARPTVTQTVQRMTASGFVGTGEGRSIVLTDEGRRKAEQMVRRHRLLERWLTDELGLDWADAHVEAGRLEHAISPEVEERLAERLGYPTTCPHGNVIPGSGAKQVSGRPLSGMEGGQSVTVVRIVEQAEEDLDFLRFLHTAGIVPGAKVVLSKPASPYEAGVPIEVDGASYSLDESVAKRILVTPNA
ncbi:metal-dependent transcriptional regulator [Alicyclobacillus sp. ALC3]|uniref:metal-dependent transcriptional regulator n=1 Tax=Alicyclobacillus sp. ALC3 TaxID=2796143 RepID=UPI0023790B51|nr:metal-dependent transcriptional regulator [Alicyclobacillus sp. ALC3]WDL96206.1 metal-dependent transcriptional regulator [Alicyclobacillus sp. ALC3]